MYKKKCWSFIICSKRTVHVTVSHLICYYHSYVEKLEWTHEIYVGELWLYLKGDHNTLHFENRVLGLMKMNSNL